MDKTIHHGRNIKRFREMFGIKQEALALELNGVYPEPAEGTWNQKKISLLEAKEVVEDGLLEEVARVLKVPIEAIKKFDEEVAINIIGNTFTDTQFAGYTVNHNPTFNPLDKLMELVEKNEKLYEALLKSEREKNELLQSMIKK